MINDVFNTQSLFVIKHGVMACVVHDVVVEEDDCACECMFMCIK